MYLTDLLNKKIINIHDGELLGRLGDADLLVNERGGGIEALILQPARRKRKGRGETWEIGEKQIPWNAVRKIGSEIIVIDFSPI